MDNSSSSEDEIFFGKIQLKEVKKRLGVLQTQPRIADLEDTLSRSEPNLSRTLPRTPTIILQAKSFNRLCETPRSRDSFVPKTWENNVTDESFLMMEQLTNVTTPETIDVRSLSNESLPSFHSSPNYDSFVGVPDDLDNTVDRVDFILNEVEKKKTKTECHNIVNKPVEKTFLKSKLPLFHGIEKPPLFKTPLKPKEMSLKTPSKFKTPIKQSGVQAYQSIVSPIGYYIKNSATAPLVQNVRSSKLIKTSTLIEKCPVVKSEGKENKIPQFLPRKAYKSAKETRMIETVASTGLPKNKQVSNMVEDILKAKIVKHEGRVKSEGVQPKKGVNVLPPSVEDSFANLSLAHADVSVCTVKTAAHTETLASSKF